MFRPNSLQHFCHLWSHRVRVGVACLMVLRRRLCLVSTRQVVQVVLGLAPALEDLVVLHSRIHRQLVLQANAHGDGGLLHLLRQYHHHSCMIGPKLAMIVVASVRHQHAIRKPQPAQSLLLAVAVSLRSLL